MSINHLIARWAEGYLRRQGRPLVGIRGHGFAELWTPRTNLLAAGPRTILKQFVSFENLVTRVGDEYYGERAAGISSPPAQVTGMQLGTSTAAVAKTGAGATIGTLVTASLVAIDGGFPTSALSGSSRRIQWKTTWAAGTATSDNIAEVVLTSQSTSTQTAVPEADSYARALLSPDVDKAAGDSLAVTWNHDLLGA